MPQHVPGSASQLFWWRGLRVAGQGKLGLSDIEATLLQASSTAVGMSKDELSFTIALHNGSE